jgi:hypothetical protein
VSDELLRLFGALAGKRLHQRAFHRAGVGVISLELTWPGWRTPFFQVDEHGWAMAADYPINAARVLPGNGAVRDAAVVLPTLCRELERRPLEMPTRLAPPFSVVVGLPAHTIVSIARTKEATMLLADARVGPSSIHAWG